MKTKCMWILVGIAALGLYVGMAAATETQLPEECLEPNLSPEVQRFCDQQRFADVPHYHVVRYAPAGAVRSIHLIDTVTGTRRIILVPVKARPQPGAPAAILTHPRFADRD